MVPTSSARRAARVDSKLPERKGAILPEARPTARFPGFPAGRGRIPAVTGLLALALIAGSSQLIPAGRPAPTLEGQTLEGRPWTANLTGEITIVEFFATWCPKCRQSLPDHHALAAARQVRLIIVDVDEEPAL